MKLYFASNDMEAVEDGGLLDCSMRKALWISFQSGCVCFTMNEGEKGMRGMGWVFVKWLLF